MDLGNYFIIIVLFISCFPLSYSSYSSTLRKCVKSGMKDKQKYRHFFKFIRKYHKNYKSTKECQFRYKVFQKSIRSIKKIKEGYKGAAKYGITFGADFTKKDWKRHTGLSLSDLPVRGPLYQAPPISIPDHVDWREKGIVNPASDQGDCGGCYAFSVVGLLEMKLAQKTGKLIKLSQQQILDCDHTESGCKEGNEIFASRYLIRHGSMLLSDYPFIEKDQECLYERGRVVAKPKNLVIIPGNEQLMAQYVAEFGPLVIGMYAGTLSPYQSGIFFDVSPACQAPPNHSLVVVGYGVEKFQDGTSIPYWIVRNSWGPKWGEGGFFRMARGYNICNMTKTVMSLDV